MTFKGINFVLQLQQITYTMMLMYSQTECQKRELLYRMLEC